MNWKSVLATALITGLVTVATGMLLFWLQSEKAELTYNSIKSIPFDEVSNSLFIQQIEIQNSGDESVEDIVLVVSFSEETLERHRILIDRAISHEKEVSEKAITLEIDSLNPGEGGSVSLMYRAATPGSSGAAISLRGKGVTGKLIGTEQESRKEPIWIALVAAYAGVFAFLMSTKRGRTMLPLVAKSVLLGRSLPRNQKYQIASALSMYGYPDKAKEYLNSSADRQYWVEADLLAAEGLNGDEKLVKDTIKVLLLITEIPNIASSSKAITYYNIARLFASLDSEKESVLECLRKARDLDKSEIESRMRKDPIFLARKEFNNQFQADAPSVAPVS